MSVRVRFAPSPTGNLHVGSARTALFNWLFARHEKGVFILRIEDTDLKRSKSEFLDDIYASLKFLGITSDEGPFFQSKRAEIYQQHAQRLLKEGKAVEREGAVMFPVPPGQVTFNDILHGDITVDTTLFESLVLMKSDGTPTYNFACVVDDADMKISHIIRGDDHIANTPKQVVLYKALGYPLPIFAHIPLIVGADRARLSKRYGATSVNEYRKVGYLPQAFINYLILLGWAPKENRELIEGQELVEAFDLKRVRRTPSQFDQKKLDWLNSQYLKKTPPVELAKLFAARLQEAGLIKAPYDEAWLARIAKLVQDRMRVLEDIEEEHAFFFQEPAKYEEEAVAKFLRSNGTGGRLAQLKERLAKLQPFETQQIEEATRGFVAELGLAPKEFIQPVRVAVTGRAVSPPLFETMAILGRDRVLKRFDQAIALAKSG